MTYRTSKSKLFCHKIAAWNCAHKRPDDTFLAKKLTLGVLASHSVRHNTEIGIKDTAAKSEAHLSQPCVA